MRKFLSRKFISWIFVFIVATYLLWNGKISENTWVIIAGVGIGIYTAIQGAIDALQWRASNEKSKISGE